MSDPVTNIEIEDVLSSIRRLVSDTDHSNAEETLDAAVDAHFVLTPALRVSNDPKPEQVVESAPAPATTSPVATLVLGPEDAIAARASLEATIAELEAAVTAQPDEWELDGSEVKTEVTWESAGFVRHASVTPAADAAEAVVEDVVSEDISTQEAEVVTPEPLVLAQADEVTEIVEEKADVTALPFRRSKFIDMEPSDHGDELSDIAEPDVDPDAELETYLSGKPSIDDKLLRDLVQQVVREELQGHLGERITRNVRKLVRREIHRVLTSQDFD